jgi:hypothetical protein
VLLFSVSDTPATKDWEKVTVMSHFAFQSGWECVVVVGGGLGLISNLLRNLMIFIILKMVIK